MVTIVDDQTLHTQAITAADTEVLQLAIPSNTYSNIVMEILGFIAFTSLSLKQNISLKIKTGSGTQLGQTQFVEQQSASAAQLIPFSIKAGAKDLAPSGGDYSFTEGAASADANTTVKAIYAVLYGIV